MHKRICTDRKGWQRPRPGGAISTVKGEFEGDQYAESFKDHKRHGVGTYTHADEAKYVGEYKDGRKHGQGTYAVSDGAKYIDAWKDGKPSKGTESDKDGQILGTYLGDVRKATN